MYKKIKALAFKSLEIHRSKIRQIIKENINKRTFNRINCEKDRLVPPNLKSKFSY